MKKENRDKVGRAINTLDRLHAAFLSLDAYGKADLCLSTRDDLLVVWREEREDDD